MPEAKRPNQINARLIPYKVLIRVLLNLNEKSLKILLDYDLDSLLHTEKTWPKTSFLLLTKTRTQHTLLFHVLKQY